MQCLAVFLSLLALLVASARLHASHFVLVDAAARIEPAPIVVFKGAPPRTRDAALTLAEYVEKISGKKPAIIDGEPSPIPERAIWVGFQPALKRLFPKIDFDLRHPEETLIAASEKHLVIAGFANTLARLLKEHFPKRELYVQLNAYGYARNPPLGVKPDANVIIASVANFHLRSPDARKLPMEQHAGWAKVSKNILWRPNLGNQAGVSWGLPDVVFAQASEDFRFVADHRCGGLFFDMLWFHWSTQGPYYYALAHLAWNPYTDLTAVMNDYYERGFGPAAAEVKAYWELLERTRMEFVAEEPSRHRAFDLPKKYTPALLAQAQAHLTAAAAKVASADEKYRRRVQFIQCGLDYTKLVSDTRTWMQKFEGSNGQDAAAGAQVEANWQRAETMRSEFPEYAINWRSVFRLDSTKQRMAGLHPKFPLSERALKELRTPGLE